MGRVTAPFGVWGWLKVHAFTATAEALLGHQTWWIQRGSEPQLYRLRGGRPHGKGLIASVEGVTDRAKAESMAGADILVSRSEFPEPPADEFYWHDLIGCEVVNLQGRQLGRVVRLFETGANDVMVLQGERERLLPFVAQVVREVDLERRSVRVDWGLDY
jgi:16S rRNA processing protein RimM